jgi:hypothetical protein
MIMTTEYHKKIEESLIVLGSEWKEKKKIRDFYRGSKRAISLVSPHPKCVLNYKPDVYFILKNNKKLIFEVLASEGSKQDIIVADVIRSFLAENVDALIFIHPDPETIGTTILEALKTIYMGLVDKGVDPEKLPSNKKSWSYMITKDEAENVNKIKDILIQYATEDKWEY